MLSTPAVSILYSNDAAIACLCSYIHMYLLHHGKKTHGGHSKSFQVDRPSSTQCTGASEHSLLTRGLEPAVHNCANRNDEQRGEGAKAQLAQLSYMQTKLAGPAELQAGQTS